MDGEIGGDFSDSCDNTVDKERHDDVCREYKRWTTKGQGLPRTDEETVVIASAKIREKASYASSNE